MHTKLTIGLFIFYYVNITLIPVKVKCGSLKDVNDLYTDLLTGYNKHQRPVKDQDDTVEVYLSFTAVAIQEFNEVLERLSVTSVLQIQWTDETIVWDKAEYGNISSVRMGYKDVWIPEVILANPAQKLDSFGKDWQKIRYDSSGMAYWFPGDLVQSTCPLNVRNFPFDIQECSIELYAWGYLSTEVKLVLIRDDIKTNLLNEHGTWNVKKTSAKATVYESVSKITFTFVLERKSQFVIVNIILPILFLCLLNVLVFILPADSGERVSYAITVLLAIAVYMTIVSDILPKTSEPMPLIAYFLMFDLIVSAVISLFTILNLRIFHEDSKKEIPKWMICIYRVLTRRKRHPVTSAACMNKDKKGVNTLYENGCNLSLCEQKMADDTTVMAVKSKDVRAISEIINHTAGKELSWKKISIMFDYIFFVCFLVSITSAFLMFLIITNVQ